MVVKTNVCNVWPKVKPVIGRKTIVVSQIHVTQITGAKKETEAA